MFEHRHYEKIAKLIKDSNSETKEGFLEELLNMFAKDNSKFSLKRFLKASGLTENSETKEMAQARQAYSLLSLSASSKNKKVISAPKLANLRIMLGFTAIIILSFSQGM